MIIAMLVSLATMLLPKQRRQRVRQSTGVLILVPGRFGLLSQIVAMGFTHIFRYSSSGFQRYESGSPCSANRKRATARFRQMRGSNSGEI